MTGPLPYLEHRLTAAGITTPLALGRMPDEPDAVIALLERPAGASRDLDARNLPALETLIVQMIARVGKDTGSAAAEAIADDAYRAIVGRHVLIEPTGLAPATFDWIRAAHTPAHVGYDANDRPLVSTTLILQRQADLTPFTPPTP